MKTTGSSARQFSVVFAGILLAATAAAQTPPQQQSTRDAAFLCVTGVICPKPDPSLTAGGAILPHQDVGPMRLPGGPVPSVPQPFVSPKLLQPPALHEIVPAPAFPAFAPAPPPQQIESASSETPDYSALAAERQREAFTEGEQIGDAIGSAVGSLVLRHRINSWCNKEPTGSWRLGNWYTIQCSNWLITHPPKPPREPKSDGAPPLTLASVGIAAHYCSLGKSRFALDGVSYSCRVMFDAMKLHPEVLQAMGLAIPK